MATSLSSVCIVEYRIEKNPLHYQEMADKHGSTPLLLNGQAAALIAQGKLEDAEPILQVS